MSMPAIMFRLLIVLLGLGWLLPSSFGADQPNIIVILADDLGSGDLGSYGCRDIPTPHLDALAASGVRFTQAYANGSFCTPTRAALIGGRYQHRFGVENLAGRDQLNALPSLVRTLPERLREAGYRTGFVGKWHLGEAAGLRAKDQGFDEVLEASALADPPRDRTEMETALALSFVENHRGRKQPFFLYLAYHAVHVPVAAPLPYVDRFSQIADERRRNYAAMLSLTDDGVGRLLRKLEEQQLRDQTWIVFSSDNGGPTTRNGINGSTNTPLRGSKCETFEGGIRVPLIMSWPGRISAGTTYDRPVITFDISATALAMAGAERQAIDGVDLLPYLQGGKSESPHPQLFWRSRTMDNNHAVRQGDWKYVVSTFQQLDPVGQDRTYVKDPPSRKLPACEMLFDLGTDPSEQHDLAAENPDKLRELRALYQRWSEEVDHDCRRLGLTPKF
jgi:arylsulfatase A-like enzyme